MQGQTLVEPRLVGGTQELTHWSGVLGPPPMAPRKNPHDVNFHRPLMTFDDAGPISDAASSYVRVFYSILGVGSDTQTRCLMATGPTQSHLQGQVLANIDGER